MGCELRSVDLHSQPLLSAHRACMRASATAAAKRAGRLPTHFWELLPALLPTLAAATSAFQPASEKAWLL